MLFETRAVPRFAAKTGRAPAAGSGLMAPPTREGDAAAGRDAHLYATDAALFSHRLPVGADLYGSDAALWIHGDVRRTHTGATDLWATDASLYATHEDRDRANAEVLKAVLRARALAMETAAHDHGGDAGEEADDAVCPVCLGGTSGRDGTDEGDGTDQQNEEDDDDGILVATLPCGHRLHLRCALRAVDACVRAGDAPRCPTCRRVATTEAFEAGYSRGRIDK